MDLTDPGEIAQTAHMLASQIQQPAPFRIDDDNGLGGIQYKHAEGHGIDNLLQGSAHPIVFRQTSGEGCIALGQFEAKLRDFLLQVPV